jgi:quinol monooxygenase YgiN
MYLVMQNKVRDYDDWKPVFDAGEPLRTKHGCTGHEIYRSDDDANDLTIMLSFPNREAGDAFLADPELKERMAEAGVLSKPRTTWVTQTQRVDYRSRKAA